MSRLLRRILLWALVSPGALMLLVTLAPPTWYVTFLTGPSYVGQEPSNGVLIVLAGDGVDGTILGETSYLRCVYAVWAWRKGHFEHLVLTGSKEATWPMRNFLTSQGIPSTAILLEERSSSTRENAAFTQPLLAGLHGPYVLMTSDYHMRRALAVFKKQGIPVQPRPVPDAGKHFTRWQNRWPVFLDLIEETAKLAYYRIHGWV